MKKSLQLFIIIWYTRSYSDNLETLLGVDVPIPPIPNNKYISRQAYSQNPYILFPSLGGTQNISESEYAKHSVARKWFGDGTWNIEAAASYMDSSGGTNLGYGANIFAQTGFAGGFAFGGLFTIMNPAPFDGLNTTDPEIRVQNLPVDRQIMPQELYMEYQYSNIVQVDAGWIGISNTPWLTYYQNNALNIVTYQGAMVNVHPGGGWLLTALAFNASQLIGSDGFSNLTLYNPQFSAGTRTEDVGNQPTSGTIAIGANYTTPGNLFSLSLWGYNFLNYTQMLYADSVVSLKANDNLKFNIGTQAAVQDGEHVNILNSAGYGNSVRSNMIGLQLGMEYQWFGLQLSYNNIWGPKDAFEGGGMISPFTYQYASDPLYTTSWMQGLIEKSAGQAFKVATPLTFLDDHLIIYPSIAYYATTAMPSSTEYNMVISYQIPQVRGLTVFAAHGHIAQSWDVEGDVSQTQVMLSYLY